MKAAYYDRFGSVDVLNVGDLPAPRPGSGEVLVRVAAAALNPKDVLVRKGKFRLISGRRFPRVPGYDFAGTVPSGGAILRDITSRLLGRSVRMVAVKSNRPDLEQLARWIDAGELRSVVDRVWPLEDSGEAHAYLETRRARGKVVLTVGR